MIEEKLIPARLIHTHVHTLSDEPANCHSVVTDVLEREIRGAGQKARAIDPRDGLALPQRNPPPNATRLHSELRERAKKTFEGPESSERLTRTFNGERTKADFYLRNALHTLLGERNASADWRARFYLEMRKTIRDIDAYATQRYGVMRGPIFLNVLRALHPSFEDLILDPGIVQRLDEFARFVRTQGLGEPHEARQRFSRHLGTQTSYRGMVLTPSRARAVAAGGMVCSGDEALHLWGMGGHIIDAVGLHIGGPSACSMFLSITRKRELARTVASLSLKDQSDGSKIFLFEIELPKLDLIGGRRRHLYAKTPYSDRYEQLAPLGIHVAELRGAREALPPSEFRFLMNFMLWDSFRRKCRLEKRLSQRFQALTVPGRAA